MHASKTCLFVALLAGGCTGEIGNAGDPPGPPVGPVCITTASPGAPVPMRRLTARQLQRSVSDVLGVQTEINVADEKLFTFRSNVSSAVDFAGAHGYLDFAEISVAAADLSACTEAGQACDAWLFDEVGPRLFRRPLDEDELDRYQAVFAAGTAEEGPLAGARWVLESMLQSPTLLYMDEVAKADGYLDDLSMASRLALTLWGQNPDRELIDRALAGELSTPEQIEAEAQRMLDDPRSLGGLTDFVDQWLRLERLNDPDARPDLEALGAETLTAMRSEPVQLFRMLLDSESNIDDLLLTSTTVALEPLSELYGTDIVKTSAGAFQLDPARRSGVLSLPGVMAALSHAEATSPTLRGFAVLSNFMCTPPPPPPPGVSVTLPDIGEGKTTRERLEAHFSDPTCNACHGPMDGMGFAFEGIDWLGRSRNEELGKPIDDSSSFPLDGDEVTVEGPAGLASVMAESESVAKCVAQQWASYGGGVPDKPETKCLIEALAARAQEKAGLRAMIIGFVASDWYRRAPSFEETEQ